MQTCVFHFFRISVLFKSDKNSVTCCVLYKLLIEIKRLSLFPRHYCIRDALIKLCSSIVLCSSIEIETVESRRTRRTKK